VATKIYEIAYSEHVVYHKKFEAEDEDAAIAAARSDVEHNNWDINKAKGWEHGSGDGSQFDVTDVLEKGEEDLDDLDD
jgi:hypothetical protein